jgi:hypothetical protein
MLSALRKQIQPATVMAFLAMVFAMTGGAFAVTGHGAAGPGKATGTRMNAGDGASATAAKKSKSKTIGKAGPRGPRGAAGPTGPAGPQGLAGPQGSAGAKGESGTPGANGTNGTNGENGVSATTESFTGKQHGCDTGGVLVKSASPEASVCNGKNGQTGFTETLPPGKTETGIWAAGPAANETFVSISFTIPVRGEVTAHYIPPEGSAEGCEGNVREPVAQPGNLCVFTGVINEKITKGEVLNSGGGNGAIGGPGAILFVTFEGVGFGVGSWAVTAPVQ